MLWLGSDSVGAVMVGPTAVPVSRFTIWMVPVNGTAEVPTMLVFTEAPRFRAAPYTRPEVAPAFKAVVVDC